MPVGTTSDSKTSNAVVELALLSLEMVTVYTIVSPASPVGWSTVFVTVSCGSRTFTLGAVAAAMLPPVQDRTALL